MAEQPITHARFAEIVAYMSSHCAQWAGSCLTLPEKVSEPMTAWSLKRFIDEMQQRINYLREDLDTTGAAEIRAKSALENGPAGLADATNDPADLSSLRKGAEVVGEAAAYDFVAGWHERQAKLFREMAEDDSRTAKTARDRAKEAAIHHAASAAALRNRAADDRRAALVSGSREDGE